jgi:hypothetical protein
MSTVVNGLITATLLALIAVGYTTAYQQQFNQPPHHSATTLNGQQHPRGATITAPANQAERVNVPGAEITLEPKAAITLLACTNIPCTFRHDTGKITASGQAIFTVRTHTIAINGESTLTHYSWKDEWNTLLRRGKATIDGQTYQESGDITIQTSGVAAE